MFAEQAKVLAALARLARSISARAVTQYDLYREAVDQLRIMETKHPGQKLGFYLQSCSCRMHDWVRYGRINPPKHGDLRYEPRDPIL